MAALLAARRGDVVKIETVSNPADPDDALNSSGALLPGPHATLAGPTFAEWLDATRRNAAAGKLAYLRRDPDSPAAGGSDVSCGPAPAAGAGTPGPR